MNRVRIPYRCAGAIGPHHPRRNRRLFATTLTLDSAMAALAAIGGSIHPVHGQSAPAASGSSTRL